MSYAPNETQIEDLKATHGKVYDHETDDGDVVVFKRASLVAHKRFMADASDDNRRQHALVNLCAECIVFPAPKSPEYTELFARLPALSTTVGELVLEVSGLSKGARARPL